ncbi:MAG: alanine/ornithine racemase family PLP-dependent enzyme [Clostridia bacterium]
MSNPRVEIDLDRLRENGEAVLRACYGREIEPTVVTKVVSAHPEIVRCLRDLGFRSMADSRLDNLRSLRESVPEVKLELLRLPMLSRVREVVDVADVSLNSEITTLRALDGAAGELGTRHGVILMIDVGDLREGMWPDEIGSFGEACRHLRNVDVVGVGTNLACYGGVIPDADNMARLIKAKSVLEAVMGTRIPMVSGGNSANWSMLEAGEMPPEVNNLRLGEVVFLGIESIERRPVEGMHRDVFTLVAEVIEIREKPSMPLGKTGQDAFGRIPHFEDRGRRLRAIAAVGRADVSPEGLIPEDPGIEILGASSDHLILDVEMAEEPPRTGEELRFGVRSYEALLRSFMSDYVDKWVKGA